MTDSITPASQDGGLSVAQRAWHLSFDDAVVDREFKTRATEVLVFEVRAEWLGRRHASFDQWGDGNESTLHMEAFFQLFIAGLAHLTTSYRRTNTDLLSNPKCPIRVFLETVLRDEADAARVSENDYDAQQRVYVAGLLEKWYKGAVTKDELLRRNMAGMSNEMLKKIHFMNGVDERKVTSYRFWVMIDEPQIKLADAILCVFETCCKMEEERTAQDKLAVDQKRSRKRANGDVGAANPAKEALTDLIAPDERYFLINEPPKLVFISGTYLRDQRILKHVEDAAFSGRVPIKNAENPVNPAKVFSVRRHFQDCVQRKDIDVRQRTLDRYFNANTGLWSFRRARPNCVLIVGAEHWQGKTLLNMYTPDFQRRTIEPRLRWNQKSRRDFAFTRRYDTLIDGSAPMSAADFAEAERQRVARAVPPLPAAAAAVAVAADAMDEDTYSEVDFEEESIRDNVGADREPAAPAVQAVDEDGDDDNDDDASSADLERRMAASRALRAAPAVEQEDDDEVVVPAAPAVPEVPLTKEQLEQLENEKQQEYMLALRMGFQDIRVRQREEELANNGTLGGTEATVCHEMRSRYFLNELPKVEAIPDRAERTRERLKLQMRSLEEYVDKATGIHSNVSRPHQALNSWACEQRSLGRMRFLRKMQFIDPRLSLFAHKVMLVYSDAEHLMAVHTSHDVLFLLYVSSRSALLYDRDTLRNNVLLYGEHATSKSFPLTELCKKMLVKDTYLSVTSQSRQAANTDTHTNDLVCVHEELQQCMISKNTKEGDMQDTFKDQLTRGASSRLLCHLALNGSRRQVVTHSEKNMVLFGACNLPLEAIAEPIVDRMLTMNQVPRTRLGVSIAQKMSIACASRHRKQTEIAEMKHDYELRQFIHNEVEKLIMIGSIVEPYLDCFSPIYEYYETMLKREFSVPVGRRQFDQLRMMLRSVTIMSAIEWLYNSPASPCYEMDYSHYHLMLLEPMLHDTEELVYFVLDMCRHTLIDPNQEALIEFLRVIWIPEKVATRIPALKEPCKAYFEKTVSGNASAAKTAPPPAAAATPTPPPQKPPQTVPEANRWSTDTSGDDRLVSALADEIIQKRLAEEAKADAIATKVLSDAIDGLFLHKTSSGVHTAAVDASAAKHDNTSPDTAGAAHVVSPVNTMVETAKKATKTTTEKANGGPGFLRNYNYISLEQSVKNLSVSLAAHMKTTGFRRAMSPTTIQAILHKMADQKTPTKQYVRAPLLTWPPVSALNDERNFAIQSNQLQIGPDQKVMLHSSLAFFERGSPHEYAIEQCMNQYTPAGFFIAGRPVSDQIPHLAYVRPSVQTQRRPEVYEDGRLVPIDMSYNVYSTQSRLEYLGMPLTQLNYNRFDPLVSDGFAKTMPNAIAPQTMVYPDDMIAHDLEVVKRNMMFRQLNAAGRRKDAFGNEIVGKQQRIVADDDNEFENDEMTDAMRKFQTREYKTRRVFTGDEELRSNAFYDAKQIGTLDLGSIKNDSTIVLRNKDAAVVAVDDDDDDIDDKVAPEKRVVRRFPIPPLSTEKELALGGGGGINKFATEIQRLDAATRWCEQGNRSVVIPDSHSNMALALDDSGSADDDDEDQCDIDEEDPQEYVKPTTVIKTKPWYAQMEADELNRR